MVDLRVLELVLLLGVEDDAVLFDEGHHGRLPARRAKEVDDYVKKPILAAELGKDQG